jgi:hypothetical protein
MKIDYCFHCYTATEILVSHLRVLTNFRRLTNFRFSYTKLWSVYVKLWSVYVTWFCFALELALEGPPGPLADGHLLPHA